MSRALFPTTSGLVRPVGSGHSFTGLVPTDGHLVIVDQLNGLLDHDPDQRTATFGAGTRLGHTGKPLEEIGQAMFKMPDIDRQTIAGAISTATHGTGIAFACLSGYVTELRLVTPSGEIIDADANSTRDLFDAARVSLGELGVITRVKMQNRTAYKLKQKSWAQPIEEILENFDEHVAAHRHFEMFPMTHSDYGIALATDETDEPINNPALSEEEEAGLDDAMSRWAQLPPEERKPVIDAVARQIEPSERVDVSYKILSDVRNSRFNEMEYSVPREAGATCLREIRKTVIDKKVDVVFPLEYRYVSHDDTWLSMCAGHEDHAAISIHRMAGVDYRPYFDLIEPIFWKYGGRPHWGKLHTLGAPELRALYPNFEKFEALRASLDPSGRMLNDHLKTLFGV